MREKNKWIAGAGVLAALLLWAWWLVDDQPVEQAPSSSAQAAGVNQVNPPSALSVSPGTSPFSAKAISTGASSNAPLSPEGQRLREEKLAQARSRFERAEQVYNSYRDATRYPFDSRPISEHPDRIRPFEPAVEEKAMRGPDGQPVKGITLKTGQDRVFMSGSDGVKFTLQALDAKGQVLPLVVTRASAQAIAETKQLVQPQMANLEFSDAGAAATGGADEIAGDGVYSARFVPQTQGFAAAQGFVGGTIRVLVFVKADGKEGVAHFDVVHTDDTPAAWAGSPREAQEQGSLNFYVPIQVRSAGRYVVSARVDDARGQPFALLSFNEELQAGKREVKLHLFGALIRDKRPAFPLKLRDIEGFLLIPDKFPDRLMMARRAGQVYTSANYNADSFSADAWSSEERERYLAEYGKDLERSRSQLESLMR